MRAGAGFLVTLFAVATANSALAHGEVPECHAFPTSLESLAVMKVTGSGPAHFFESGVDRCERSAERCQKQAYVVPGDRVFASPAGQGFSCAWYVDGKGRVTWGLLKAHGLVEDPVGGPAKGELGAWVGVWRWGRGKDELSPEAEISIASDSQGLNASGDATYPYRDGTGELSAHVGSFGRTKATLTNGRLTIVEDDCRLSMLRLGDRLLVLDNGQCPVPSASFSGFYRRVTRTSEP